MHESDSAEEVIFNAARQLADEEKRTKYLDLACEGNPELRARIERLLGGAVEADSFFGRNAAFAAEVLSPAVELAPGPSEALVVEQPGASIGRYKLLEKLGEGGFGAVWMVQQKEPVKRRLALKIIKLGMDTRQVVARFEAERQALAMMDHPNIAKVFDAGATDTGRPYFVMELVRGVRITEYCEGNQLRTQERLKLFMQVCRAIQHAHQKGIIHRDIKPSNILVTLHDGVPVPKVIDFGIAKATQHELTEKTVFTQFRQFLGTPAYISPEQAEMSGLDIDTRSDIYSLGVLLYELLTGTTPFDTQELIQAGLEGMRQIIRERQPPKPSTRLTRELSAKSTDTPAQSQIKSQKSKIGDDLDWIVMKCLEKDRARRYETANGLARDLARHLNNEPVLARPPSRLYEFQKTLRRHWVGFAAVGAVLVALTIGVVVSSLQTVRARRAESLGKQRLEQSQAVTRFLAEVFANADPARDGRTITVAESLGLAAKRLETGLASQPLTRANLQDALAWTYHTLGLNQEAIPLGEKARDYFLAAVGPNDPGTLRIANNLAIYYDEVGRADDALKLKEQLLAQRRKVLGPEHPDTLQAMNNVANAYATARRLDEAIQLHQQALALRRKVSGPEDPETLLVMRNLAADYARAGRFDEALKLGEELLPLRRKVSGAEHPETLSVMNNLAVTYDELGRHNEALKMREEVLALRRKVLGPEHRDTLIAMYNLALSYFAVGRPQEGLKLFDQTLSLRRKVLGPEHPDTLMSLNALALMLATSAAPEIRNGTNAVTLAETAAGATHHKFGPFLDTLAAAYAEVQQFDKAVAVQQESIKLAPNEAVKNELESRLKLYQANKPYREKANP